MLDDDSILDASILFTEAEVLAEFREACEAEAEQPGQHAGKTQAGGGGFRPDARAK